MSNGANILLDKTITKIELASDKKAIRFTISDNETVVAKCDGDCCSNTWIENIEMPAAGLPAKVLEVVDLDFLDGGELQFYGLKLVTDKGDFVLDYRNESNGYYGGNLCWPDDSYFYGGVFGQNISNEEWEAVA